jgi:hypothetical protein
MTLPLDGIRVIDLGQVYAAPYCTLQLAAMGADIIKIEPPVTGGVLRRPELPPGGAGYSFLMLNANKRSVTINLKKPRGREIVLKLLEDAGRAGDQRSVSGVKLDARCSSITRYNSAFKTSRRRWRTRTCLRIHSQRRWADIYWGTAQPEFVI